jgi:hypothetical protein
VAGIRALGDRVGRSVRRSVATPPASDQPAISTIPASEASVILVALGA